MKSGYIFLPEMKGAPFVRIEAYCIAYAISVGLHNNFSWGTKDGIPFVKIKNYHTS